MQHGAFTVSGAQIYPRAQCLSKTKGRKGQRGAQTAFRRNAWHACIFILTVHK